MKKKTSSTVKEKELFDFLTGIYTDQSPEFFDNLTASEKKKYKNSRYMIHRFLSMNVAYAPLVNLVQRYPSMPDRAHYLFLTGVIPRGKQFNKYIKGTTTDTYSSWLVDLVATHFQVSKVEATQYIEIYYAQNKLALRELCELYGVDKKQLKGANL